MNDIFLIEDTRFLEHFKDKSFSGFKKTSVIKTLFKMPLKPVKLKIASLDN